jgi:hypothetical protein
MLDGISHGGLFFVRRSLCRSSPVSGFASWLQACFEQKVAAWRESSISKKSSAKKVQQKKSTKNPATSISAVLQGFLFCEKCEGLSR